MSYCYMFGSAILGATISSWFCYYKYARQGHSEETRYSSVIDLMIERENAKLEPLKKEWRETQAKLSRLAAEIGNGNERISKLEELRDCYSREDLEQDPLGNEILATHAEVQAIAKRSLEQGHTGLARRNPVARPQMGAVSNPVDIADKAKEVEDNLEGFYRDERNPTMKHPDWKKPEYRRLALANALEEAGVSAPQQANAVVNALSSQWKARLGLNAPQNHRQGVQ